MIEKISCKPVADSVNRVTTEILKRCGHTPQLAVKVDDTVSDGDDMYLRGIIKDATKMGIHVGGSPDTADGILYLGKSWSRRIHLDKDVDGVAQDKTLSVVKAICMMMHNCLPGNESLKGKSALVIGRGPVGLKTAVALLKEDVTVTVAHSKTPVTILQNYYNSVDLLINAGAIGLSFAQADNPRIVIDVSGGANTYVGSRDILLVDKIGALTRANLLNTLAIKTAGGRWEGYPSEAKST